MSLFLHILIVSGSVFFPYTSITGTKEAAGPQTNHQSNFNIFVKEITHMKITSAEQANALINLFRDNAGSFWAEDDNGKTYEMKDWRSTYILIGKLLDPDSQIELFASNYKAQSSLERYMD